ncbi:MAG: hypothetical protein ACFFDC_07735 [Promethearchaeota archaeon]
MNRKKIQLIAAGVTLVALVLMSQSGITSATWQAPKRILADTLVGEDPFIEALELIAAEDTSLIAQYYQLNGEKMFPLDPSHSAFDELTLMYIISSNQANWRDYWPRSIWEFRDGATILLHFSQGIEDSLDDAAEIIPALNAWMGTTLDILYGVETGPISDRTTTLFYWGYMSPQNHSDFIIDEFYDVLSTGGYTNFITNEKIASAPVSVVGTGLVRNETDYFIPVAVAAFILENSVSVDGDISNMSITSAFDYSGSIRPAPNSFYSKISFQLPYVATVYDSYPETDNLYPELVGNFDWTLKAGHWIDVVYNDIYVTFSKDEEEISTFPQITSELSADMAALQSVSDPKLNFTITMTNSGDEIAYDTVFAWDLGDEPEPHYISVFDSNTYDFDPSIKKFFNFTSGLLVDTLSLTEIEDPNNPGTWFNMSREITGWFINKSDGNAVVQPQTTYHPSLGHDGIYEVDAWASISSVYINKSFFNFKKSSNLVSATINDTFYLIGEIDRLNPGASESFWWSIDDLPSEADTFIWVDINNSNGDGQPLLDEYGLTYWQVNWTVIDNTSTKTGGITNLKDYIVKTALDEGQDLRFPPINPEFIPGVFFVYEDGASREYFGWSNGLVLQLYDDEAILKTTVSLNASIYEMYEFAEINVTVENIGDAPASDVSVQGFHAQLGPNWELRDIKEFSEETALGTINPGEKAHHTFIRQVETFIGIHPVGIVVDYTTEKDEGVDGAFNSTTIMNLASNLLVALVMPKDDTGEPVQEYPTPIVNVSVSWIDENGDDIENGDLIEIRTEVKNLGDEATTIKLFSYFPTRMASIDVYAQYYDGKNFKVTDASGNIITGYDEGFAMDHPDWPITIAAVAGLHLAPGESIVFYYKLTVTDKDSLIVPPVAVEYDSRYPMAGTSGMEGGEEAGEPSTIALRMSHNMRSEGSPLKFSIQNSGSDSSWTSYSDSSLLSAYASVVTPEPSTSASETSEAPPSEPSGVNGFTTLTSFISENMRLMIVVLAIPILVLSVRELRRTRK